MKEKLSLGQSFPTLGARIIYAYLASYPDFVPSFLIRNPGASFIRSSMIWSAPAIKIRS